MIFLAINEAAYTNITGLLGKLSESIYEMPSTVLGIVVTLHPTPVFHIGSLKKKTLLIWRTLFYTSQRQGNHLPEIILQTKVSNKTMNWAEVRAVYTDE